MELDSKHSDCYSKWQLPGVMVIEHIPNYKRTDVVLIHRGYVTLVRVIYWQKTSGVYNYWDIQRSCKSWFQLTWHFQLGWILSVTYGTCQIQIQIQIQHSKSFYSRKYTDICWSIMRLKPMRVYLPHYFMDCYYIANILTSAKRAG